MNYITMILIATLALISLPATLAGDNFLESTAEIAYKLAGRGIEYFSNLADERRKSVGTPTLFFTPDAESK